MDRRALTAQAVNTFAAFEPEPGLKFDKIYEVYSQKFRREDLGEDAPYDPKTIPEAYPTSRTPAMHSSTSAPSSAWPSIPRPRTPFRRAIQGNGDPNAE